MSGCDVLARRGIDRARRVAVPCSDLVSTDTANFVLSLREPTFVCGWSFFFRQGCPSAPLTSPPAPEFTIVVRPQQSGAFCRERRFT
jgi:hypothetical protein